MVGILKSSMRGVIIVMVLIVILLAGCGLYFLLTPPPIKDSIEPIAEEATREQVAYISVVTPDK